MAIDRKTVEHIAHLAQLGLTEQELDSITPELDAIIGYFDKLNELDMEQIADSESLEEVHRAMRKDQARPGLSTEQVLNNAPDRYENFFRVPKVIDKDQA